MNKLTNKIQLHPLLIDSEDHYRIKSAEYDDFREFLDNELGHEYFVDILKRFDKKQKKDGQKNAREFKRKRNE
jgi:hypothetical protein